MIESAQNQAVYRDILKHAIALYNLHREQMIKICIANDKTNENNKKEDGNDYEIDEPIHIDKKMQSIPWL